MNNKEIQKTFSLTDFRTQTSKVMKEVKNEQGPIYLTRYGKRVAVLLNIDYYEKLLKDMSEIERQIK